ncbi:MAG: hypothetical protein FRX49_10856 [Trebouxia sp. A1-2]|nr:MAG: hypothetical protein FRX49_10856 [Trebouxia sp. A1-2]
MRQKEALASARLLTFPPRTHASTVGMVRFMAKYPPTRPGWGILNLVRWGLRGPKPSPRDRACDTERHRLTLGLLVEAIPLHLAPSNITAHKVAPIAKEHSVPHGVNVWRSEVSNASVAGAMGVAMPLQSCEHIINEPHQAGPKRLFIPTQAAPAAVI